MRLKGIMQIRIDYNSMRSIFFDREKVTKTVDARTKKVLAKFGSYVRQTSRESIRNRKGSSKPGRPPFSHTGTLKKFIFFGCDAMRRSVVIGPVTAPGKSGKAPTALEHGTSVTLPNGNRTDVMSRKTRPENESPLTGNPK